VTVPEPDPELEPGTNATVEVGITVVAPEGWAGPLTSPEEPFAVGLGRTIALGDVPVDDPMAVLRGAVDRSGAVTWARSANPMRAAAPTAASAAPITGVTGLWPSCLSGRMSLAVFGGPVSFPSHPYSISYIE
jgi:hypothetical protein